MNRFVSVTCIVIVMSAAGSVHCPSANAQSLTQTLKSESLDTLTREAREKGNAIRGAILFTQQNLACTKCHGPGVDGKRFAPDLTVMPDDVTDAHLVESLLLPSKTIRKGYESITVLTNAGKVVTGRLMEQDADSVTLQVPSFELPRITINRDDIDTISPNIISPMPDNLMDQVKDRSQFLDLVRYLMELNETKRKDVAVAKSASHQSIRPELFGEVLIKEFNCAACHSDDAAQSQLTAKSAPLLSWSAGRISPEHLARFIADPLHVKPGTTMPDVMRSLNDDERQAAATEITHYLVSLSDRSFATTPVDAAAAQRGGELFHTVGCVACHSPRDESHVETLAESSVPLGPIADKYSTSGLVEFLKDPLQSRPSGRMPQMKLTHWEATDIANYLMSDHDEQGARSESSFDLNQSLAKAGKTRFDKLRCAACHSSPGHSSPSSGAKPTSLPLAEVNRNNGCLSGQSGPWPMFDLSPDQTAAIQSALDNPQRKLSTPDQVAVTLTAFRCVNCHQRGELGGVSDERNPHFQTADPNLGPQGRIPPTLTGIGAKLNPQWMRQVLASGRAIRPYVLTRMPQFGINNVAHLVDDFAETDQLPEVQYADFQDETEIKKVGTELVGTSGLNCIVCHTFQLQKSANMPAVDLTEMAERLQKKWFYHYMRDPQRLSPNTIMPSFWPGGRSLRADILDGDTNLQIEAVWQYLLDGRQARTPRGLINEPLELLATDEAVMLRRSYPGIGKRGIGVGYPLGVNIAFDAEQMRLAMIWKGKFADPGGVWRSQGHGNVRPLGDSLMNFAKGPDLDDAERPWQVDEQRPPDHHFGGYSLDEKMRPEFRYRFAEVDVHDRFVDTVDEASGQPYLRRVVSLTAKSARGGLAFRAASGKSIVQVDERKFRVDDRLTVQIDQDHDGKIAETTDGQQLTIPLAIEQSPTELTLEYRW
ncbi:c-type cytochrome [Stieleria varia]|uniref:Cytochrome c n=1 Tax=Stieleria varia TaxID=2528005 RepID=A0A5C6AY26_9BACT|nr:c-type cytochrome [Stieleria varia]TWU04833.1 Cytochrome c [Stieleria varia]